MAGSKALRKIQLGLETTPGTSVAATALWRGKGVIENQQPTVWSEEDIAIIGGVDRSYIPKIYAALPMDEVEATFEQLPYILSAGVKNVVTGAADGPGTDKIYSYDFPTTALNTVKSYTLEGGDDQQEYEMEYGTVEKFSLSGKGENAVMMSADWFGRQVAKSSFTGAIAVPSVEDMVFQKCKLYIDVIGGTWGTTQKTLTLLEWKLNCVTGWQPTWTGDGNLYFSFIQMDKDKIEVTCEVTFEHDASGIAEYDNYVAQTARLVQIKCEGSSVGTPGTTYSKKTLLVNLAGKWEKFDKLDSFKGNDIVKGTFRARYNVTAAKFAQIVVVNELTALP